MHDDDEDDDREEQPRRKSLLGQDLDLLTLFVKRSAAIGAVLGFLHHLRCFGGH